MINNIPIPKWINLRPLLFQEGSSLTKGRLTYIDATFDESSLVDTYRQKSMRNPR